MGSSQSEESVQGFHINTTIAGLHKAFDEKNVPILFFMDTFGSVHSLTRSTERSRCTGKMRIIDGRGREVIEVANCSMLPQLFFLRKGDWRCGGSSN